MAWFRLVASPLKFASLVLGANACSARGMDSSPQAGRHPCLSPTPAAGMKDVGESTLLRPCFYASAFSGLLLVSIFWHR
jgi:hypothetical protein